MICYGKLLKRKMSNDDAIVMLSNEMTIHFISIVNPFLRLLLYLCMVLKLRTSFMLIDMPPNKVSAPCIASDFIPGPIKESTNGEPLKLHLVQ